MPNLRKKLIMPKIIKECDKGYEALWVKKDKPYYRIVVCKDQLQYIVQRYYQRRWRNKSYHMKWDSLLMRYPDFISHGLRKGSPNLLDREKI